MVLYFEKPWYIVDKGGVFLFSQTSMIRVNSKYFPCQELTHVAFIRCVQTEEQPTLSEQDKKQMRDMLSKAPFAMAVIVTYPIKIGSVKAWEMDLPKSSSSSTCEGIKEVDLQFISRRVEGEQFNVYPLFKSAPLSARFKGLINDAFQKHLDVTRPEVTKQETFRRVPVLADGYCFWHAFLRASLPETFDVPRGKNWAPLSRETLVSEIEMAKGVRQETLEVLMHPTRTKPTEALLNEMTASPQVSLNAAQQICLETGTRFRITLSEEAWFTSPKIHENWKRPQFFVCIPCLNKTIKQKYILIYMWNMQRVSLLYVCECV